MNMRASLALVAGLLAASAPALAADHPTGSAFLRHAIEGDNSEMKLGAIAARRGASAPVRAYGRMLAHDHSQGRVQAAALAPKLHSWVPKSMAPEAIKEMTKLNRLSGAKFDREFASYMVNDHKQDIADFEAEAASHDDPRLLRLANEILPVLRKHLQVAQSLTR